VTSTASERGTRHTLRIDDCDLSYLRGGAGPPLLFLHGAGGVARWTPWMETLAGSYDVIVPDHPGWGRSSTPEWFDNVHDLAYFYLDLIDALGLERVHLAGQSIGGWIAAEMAVRSTSRLATLTLIAAAGLRVAGAETFDIFLASPEANVRASFYDQTLADAQLAATAVTGEDVDIFLRNRFAAARVAWQPRLYDPHLAKWLHRIDVPTLVVWGANDAILPIALQAEYVRLIPGAAAATIDRCGHIPLAERPAAVIERFTAFTDGVPA
jgi:pimeloyl-ACP methyl ester carboxylesterase